MDAGYDKGRVAWFASMKGYVGLYLRPPIINEHAKELENIKLPFGHSLSVGLKASGCAYQKTYSSRMQKEYCEELGLMD